MIEDSADRLHLKMYEKEEKNVRTTREKWENCDSGLGQRG